MKELKRHCPQVTFVLAVKAKLIHAIIVYKSHNI